MAKSYSLRSVVAIAVPLGVVCLLVLVVSSSIILRYYKLSARRQTIEQRTAKGDLRRYSASGAVDRHDSHNSGHSSKETRLIESGKHLASYKSRKKPRTKSNNLQASSDLAIGKETLGSTAALRYSEKDGSLLDIGVVRSAVKEQSVSNNANGQNGEPKSHVLANNRQSYSHGTRHAFSQTSPSFKVREAGSSNHCLRKQIGSLNPHAFLIESGLGSTAELVNDWDSGSRLLSPPMPPYRSPARSSTMTGKAYDLQHEIQPALPLNSSCTENDIRPPPKSVLRSVRPTSQFSYAYSRKLSTGSISQPSLKCMRTDRSGNNFLVSSQADSPRSKASPMLEVSIATPPKQRPRLNVSTPAQPTSSTPIFRPLELNSSTRTSTSHGETSSTTAIPIRHVEDRNFSSIGKQNDLSSQDSSGNVSNDGTDKLLRLALHAFDEQSSAPLDDESLSSSKDTDLVSPTPNITAASDLLTEEIDTINATTLTRETKDRIHPQTDESLTEQLLVPQSSDVFQWRIMKTLQNDEEIHEVAERVGRAYVDDGNPKHSLRGSVVGSDSAYSRSRANSSKRLLPPNTGHGDPTGASRLSTTSVYERSLGKIDSSTAQFKEWLGAAPGHPKPTPLSNTSATDALKAVPQRRLLVERKTSFDMILTQPTGQRVSDSTVPKSHTATNLQHKIIESEPDHNSFERENGEPLKGEKPQSPLGLAINAAPNLSRSTIRGSDSLVSNKQQFTEQSRRPHQASVKQVSTLKPQSRSNNHRFSESIRKIASSLEAPISPRSPGYQPGQQLDIEPVGNARRRYSQKRKSVFRHSMSNLDISKPLRSQVGESDSLRFEGVAPGKVNNHAKRAVKVNKPLPMTPSVQKGGVLANLKGARFVVTVPYEGNLSDELNIHYNDVVEIYEVFDDGWCSARIAESAIPSGNRDQRGVCPKSCLVAL